MDTLSDTIKRTLSMHDVALHYGYQPNRAGALRCPFHNDKTASMKIYNEPGRGFHCYGCNTGGSVIDFVMRLYGIPFHDACVRLNDDFRLGLTDAKPDPAEVSRHIRERQSAERLREIYEAVYDGMTAEHRRLWYAKIHKAPASPDDEIDPEYVEACHRLGALDEWFYTHRWKDR